MFIFLFQIFSWLETLQLITIPSPIIIAIIPIEILRAKLKKRHRELTELETDLGGGEDRSSAMMRYLQDNQRYSQQDLSVPFNQQDNYYQQQFCICQ